MRLAAQERYEKDQVFAYIVDTLYSMLCVNHGKLQFTPTEMREAAMLACTKYEFTHVRPLFITKDGAMTPAMFGGKENPTRTATGARMEAETNAKKTK